MIEKSEVRRPKSEVAVCRISHWEFVISHWEERVNRNLQSQFSGRKEKGGKLEIERKP